MAEWARSLEFSTADRPLEFYPLRAAEWARNVLVGLRSGEKAGEGATVAERRGNTQPRASLDPCLTIVAVRT